MTAKKIARLALFLSLLIVGSQLAIPIQPVPITLQTLVVILIGGLLSPMESFTVMLGYLILGLIGLPIFAGFSGGIEAILTPSFGFILSFLISAPVLGHLLAPKHTWSLRRYVSACAVHYFITYAIGLTYLAIVLRFTTGQALAWHQIFLIGLVPFLIGDLIKYLFGGIVLVRLLHSRWLIAH